MNRRKLGLILCLFLVLSACQPKTVYVDNVPMERIDAWKHTNSLDIQQTDVLRIIDRELGNVCYYVWAGGNPAMSCVPLRETQ